jgi:hypothetical protein
MPLQIQNTRSDESGKPRVIENIRPKISKF